jgi:hypothetical protein
VRSGEFNRVFGEFNHVSGEFNHVFGEFNQCSEFNHVSR